MTEISKALADYLELECELLAGRAANKGKEFEDEMTEELSCAYSLLSAVEQEHLHKTTGHFVGLNSVAGRWWISIQGQQKFQHEQCMKIAELFTEENDFDRAGEYGEPKQVRLVRAPTRD